MKEITRWIIVRFSDHWQVWYKYEGADVRPGLFHKESVRMDRCPTDKDIFEYAMKWYGADKYYTTVIN